MHTGGRRKAHGSSSTSGGGSSLLPLTNAGLAVGAADEGGAFGAAAAASRLHRMGSGGTPSKARSGASRLHVPRRWRPWLLLALPCTALLLLGYRVTWPTPSLATPATGGQERMPPPLLQVGQELKELQHPAPLQSSPQQQQQHQRQNANVEQGIKWQQEQGVAGRQVPVLQRQQAGVPPGHEQQGQGQEGTEQRKQEAAPPLQDSAAQQQQQQQREALIAAVPRLQQAVRAQLRAAAAQVAAAQQKRHAAAAAAAAVGVPPPPRVALLFLVRGPMPLEPVWRQFFETAALVSDCAVSVSAVGRTGWALRE